MKLSVEREKYADYRWPQVSAYTSERIYFYDTNADRENLMGSVLASL